MYSLTVDDLESMNRIASQSIIHGFTHNSPKLINPNNFSKELQKNGLTYISITLNGENMGCLGNLKPMPLFLSANINSFNACFRDYRFYRLNKTTSFNCDFKIYYLNTPILYHNITKNELSLLLKGNETVTITNGYKNSIFLNFMQKEFESKNQFVDALLEKANLEKDYDFNNLEICIYNTLEGKSFKIQDYMDTL